MKVLSKAAALETKQMVSIRPVQVFSKSQTNQANLVYDANYQEYINTERRLLEKLRHPFICSLHFAFQTAKKLYLLLDYCPGGGL